jgi:hypothetical protein
MLEPPALDYIDFLQPYLKTVKNWQLHYCIIPHRCILTGKLLWFTDCYRGTRTITGTDSTIIERLYIDKHEFIVWSLGI